MCASYEREHLTIFISCWRLFFECFDLRYFSLYLSTESSRELTSFLYSASFRLYISFSSFAWENSSITCSSFSSNTINSYIFQLNRYHKAIRTHTYIFMLSLDEHNAFLCSLSLFIPLAQLRWSALQDFLQLAVRQKANNSMNQLILVVCYLRNLTCIADLCSL